MFDSLGRAIYILRYSDHEKRKPYFCYFIEPFGPILLTFNAVLSNLN